MSPRIQELATQCEDWHEVEDGMAEMIFNQSKFAELIIAECLLALEPNGYESRAGFLVEEKLYIRSADKIRKHLGVK